MDGPKTLVLCALGILLAMVPSTQGKAGGTGSRPRRSGPPASAPPGSGPPDTRFVNRSELTAFCSEAGSSASYAEILSDDGISTVRWISSTTGCPNHVNWEINPNPAREIPSNTTIPAYPMLQASGGKTDLSNSPGAVGIMLNGVSIFSSWARDQADSYENSAFAIEGDTFDLCGGHSTMEGWYHYHSTPGCLQEQAMVAAGKTSSEHSPQLGWSYDGFPVYGQLGPGGIEMLFCGNDGANDTYCLDSCSGYEGELTGVDDFKYRYYSTCGFSEVYFPFTTNCYRGCCPQGMICDLHVSACGDSPEEGYGSGYVPAIGSALSEKYDAELIQGNDTTYIGLKNRHVDCSLYLGSAGTLGTPYYSGASETTAITVHGLVASLAALLVPIPLARAR